MYKVAIIVGSLRKESLNKKLAKAFVSVGSDIFDFSYIDLSDVPMYNQDHEMDMPAPAARMKAEIAAADAILFVTPEYNRSVPALIKNAVDWGSRPYGKNVWGGKPAAIAGHTPSSAGTAVAQSHLRSILTILSMPLMSQPEMYITEKAGVISDDGTVNDEATKKFFRDFLTRFSNWIKLTKG